MQLEAIRDWLVHYGGSGCPDAVVPPIEPQHGETQQEAIARVRRQLDDTRRQISVLGAEQRRIEEAPLPPDEIKRRLIALVDQAAAEGEPMLSLLGGRVELDTIDVSASAFHPPNGSAFRLLCWLLRDAVVERVTAGVDAIEGGLPMAGRDRRVDELQTQITLLQRQEFALTAQLFEHDTEFDRSGVDPALLLGLVDGRMPELLQEAAE